MIAPDEIKYEQMDEIELPGDMPILIPDQKSDPSLGFKDPVQPLQRGHHDPRRAELGGRSAQNRDKVILREIMVGAQ